MNCEQATKELSLLLYDELSFEQEEALHQHLEQCENCRQLLAREKTLHHALDRMEVPVGSDVLTKCRRDLRGRLSATAAGRNRLRQLSSMLWRSFSMPWLKPVGALALVAAGFGMSRMMMQTPAGALGSGTAEPVAMQVRYLQPDPASGNVRIVLDETRQRVMTGSLEDAAIQQVLLSAAKESSDPGLRVVSMDMLKNRAQSAVVRRALLQAVQIDVNPGVRMKALEGLKSYGSDPEARKVLARVLLTDDNPGVRIQAIDILAQSHGVENAGVFQELLETESNNYVRLRSQKALRDMNASVETF
jgi:predicted anti-sigma-YlaC factor YlaD